VCLIIKADQKISYNESQLRIRSRKRRLRSRAFKRQSEKKNNAMARWTFPLGPMQVEAGYLGWRLAQDFTMITGEDRRLVIKKKLG
jgi:hypothetical protein